jgi:class 3 adenylate cyclase/pimeloyl-ACP methyl ester carboxylesterase
LREGTFERETASVDVPDIRYAKSGDVSIAYAVIGDGPFDVVFVSGWVLSNLEVAWEGSAREFYERMAKSCRLILFDKRGTGLSDRIAGLPDLQTRMDDVRAVMDAAGSDRAAILGFSEGGPMSILFAASHPDRATALVLYGTFPTFRRAPDYPWGSSPDEMEAYLRTSAQQAGTDADLERRLRGLAPTTADDAPVRRWWGRWVRVSASPGAIAALGRMNSSIDVRDILPAVRVPTLVLHREGDTDVLLDEGRYLAEHIPTATLVTLAGLDHGWWVNSTEIADAATTFLMGLWNSGAWGPADPDRVLATVLFTDIVDSTAKVAELGDRRWRELLQAHHAAVRRQLTRYSGQEVDTAGDGFFATFDGPARAIRCASAITASVHDLGLEARAGVHTGECEIVDGKLGGIAVHIGARIAARAEPGQVLVSGTVRDLVAGSGLEFASRGSVELKGIPGAWPVYAVTAA